jgi:hypothetical protein
MSESGKQQIKQLFWYQQGVWSGRGDLNARPPAPKAGALPGCATPRQLRSLHSKPLLDLPSILNPAFSLKTYQNCIKTSFIAPWPYQNPSLRWPAG